MTSDFVARLAAIDTCAVSDALDRFALKGAVIGLSQVSNGKRIAGTACSWAPTPASRPGATSAPRPWTPPDLAR
jgi:4-hydroxy-4-methyl-2-oxoglutarate aldolase